MSGAADGGPTATSAVVGGRREEIERIVFFGTPQFAVPTLEALAASGREPVLVVSQPAREAGRGRQVRQPPVAQWAQQRGLALAQPRRVRDPDFLTALRRLQPDLAVVVAFGQIFRRSLLDLPRLGCVNVHASLLPAWRGASPIAAAIRAGESETGVTTMQMEAGLDSGPILLQRTASIGATETCGELTERLSRLGAEVLVETLEAVAAGTVAPRRQDDACATFAPQLSRDDSWLDLSRPAAALHAQIRAHDPWPGSRVMLAGRELMIRRAAPGEAGPGGDGEAECSGTSSAFGVVVGPRGEALAVRCGGGTMLLLLRVQRPGRAPVRGVDLWNGERLRGGERLSGPTP